MKLNKELFTGILLLLFTFPLFSQNAFCPSTLGIYEEIVVDEKLKAAPYPKFELNYLNEDLSDQTISELIWKELTTKDFELYRFDFVPDIFNIKETQILGKWWSNDMDKTQLAELSHNIGSIVFFDEWALNEENFVLTKELAGYSPIRFHQREADDVGNAPIDRIPLGIIRFPKEKRKEYAKPNNKNLIPVKKIAYEFLMINKYWFNAVAKDNSISPNNGGPSLYYKENNIQWGEFHAKKIIDVIFDQIVSEKRVIYDLEEDNPTDIYKIHEEIFPEEYEEQEEYDYDPGYDLMPMDSTYKTYELKDEIYSLIFFEEWSIDTSSLYIHKNITAVAPVYWKSEWDDSTWGPAVDESGNRIYTKTPLFKIYFNSKDEQ